MNLNTFNNLILQYNDLKKNQNNFWDRRRLRKLKKQIYRIIMKGARDYADRAYGWAFNTYEQMFLATAEEKK